MAKVLEGFWYSEREPHLPMPVPGEMEDREGFVAALRRLQSRLPTTAYRGWSNCRICGGMNGSEEYKHGVWEWPSGYLHYIVEHGVVPSPEFEAMVRAEAGVR